MSCCCVISLAGCGLGGSGLDENAISTIESDVAKDLSSKVGASYSGIPGCTVELIQEGPNKLVGVANCRGESIPITVTIDVNGNGYVWKTDN